jgi:hypothetical protein
MRCGCIFAQVPEGALAIYQHTDRFRQQIGSLDLMVSLYNKLQRTTLAVEWPLVAGKLEAVGRYAGRTVDPAVPMPSLFTGLNPVWNSSVPLRLVCTKNVSLCRHCAKVAACTPSEAGSLYLLQRRRCTGGLKGWCGRMMGLMPTSATRWSLSATWTAS